MKTTYGSRMTDKPNQSGLTLVEILVAMLLGLFIIAGVSSVFLSNKKTYTVSESLSRLQEDGRFVMETFGSRLRSAGYAGCFGDISQTPDADNILTLSRRTDFAWSLAKPIQGFNNVPANATISDAPTTTSPVATASIAGTDVLVIKGMVGAVPLAATSVADSFEITAANENRFLQGEILLVANCDNATVFQLTSKESVGANIKIKHAAGGTYSPGNSSGNIATTFGPDAQIGRLQTSMYNIQNGVNGRPALFERRLVVTGGNVVALTANELLPNVVNMQLAYGVNNTGDADADVYLEAPAAADWANVVSIRFALLLESAEDNQIPNAESYTFNAATFSYDKDNPVVAANANKRFRRIFSGVVALRNRVLQ